MNKCPQCKVILYNKAATRPLCHCVVEELEGAEEKRVLEKFGAGAPYPNVQRRHKWVRFALRLVLFVFVIVEALLLLINYLTTPHFWWAAITGVALAYGYLFLVVWIRNDSGFALKVGLQIMFTMVVLFEIDKFTGNYGWALQWAIPGVILLGDGIVFILMMLNRSRWVSYSLLLILMGVCSIAIICLYFTGVIGNLVLPVICVAVTGIYLLGTITFGEHDVKRELGRRFHI